MDETVGRETRDHERKLAIAPYIERLGECRNEQDPSGSETTRTPAIAELNPWELQALRKGLDTESRQDGDWEKLIAEGVALQAMYLEELESLQQDDPPTPEELDIAHAPLLRTAAIGMALMEELQRVIDAMILGGKMGDAKKLSSFRGKLSRAVSEIRERVGDEAFAEAESTASLMISPVAEVAAAKKPAMEEDDGPQQHVRFDRQTGRSLGVMTVNPPRDRTKPIAIVFAVAVLAWLVLILPRAWKTEIPVLEAEQVTVSPVIEQVLPRPPSLFLVVDGPGWREMPTEQREELVRQVGDTAGSNGYTGVQLRTADGTTVGQWTKALGARLVVPERTGS